MATKTSAPARKGSGEKATQEARERRAAEQARRLKDEKAASERDVHRQDDLVSAGPELREGVEPPKDTKAQAKREEKAFAKPTTVDVLEIAGDTQHVVVRFDDASFTLDAQQALALRRVLNAAVINLNV